jgi:hypothetical protein
VREISNYARDIPSYRVERRPGSEYRILSDQIGDDDAQGNGAFKSLKILPWMCTKFVGFWFDAWGFGRAANPDGARLFQLCLSFLFLGSLEICASLS